MQNWNTGMEEKRNWTASDSTISTTIKGKWDKGLIALISCYTINYYWLKTYSFDDNLGADKVL